MENIDYALLNKQLLELLNIRFSVVSKQEHKDALDGVIELLETIQDEENKRK